jgi:DNA-binding MarR family transcriptional regulator
VREFFDLSDKYGFTAPLVSAPDTLDLKVYLRLCGALSVSPTTIAVISDVFIALQDIDERVASFDFLAERINRKASNIRHHLVTLEKANLIESEFITTDPIRRRRGKLFTLAIPKGQAIASSDSTSTPEVSNYQLVASNTVETIDIDRYDDKSRFLELQIVRYLVKAMRTNRKDKAGIIRVKLKEEGRVKPISITARAEEGRLIYLPDMSYYAGAITWLINHISERIDEAETIGETFTLPLEPLISMAKDIPLSDSSAGGYMNNAIHSLQRISATTFDMRDFYDRNPDSIKDIEMYYKLFRLEALVTYEDERQVEKKAAVVQFPRSTVKNIIAAVRAKRTLDDMLLIDSDVFATKNEIEILFGLWAREHLITGRQAQKIYTWNELRESVAPSSSLSEFKRKFSNMVLANADPEYKAKIHDAVKDKIVQVVETCHLSEPRKGELVVEYGRATVQGYLINIGYSPEQGASVIAFRRDMSALHILNHFNSQR